MARRHSTTSPHASRRRAIRQARMAKMSIMKIMPRGGSTFAIEVKAEENLRAKSLRAFKSAHPEVSAVRFSLSGYREQEWMRNVPLYAVSCKSLWA